MQSSNLGKTQGAISHEANALEPYSSDDPPHPPYPSKLYDVIYDYHASHRGSFSAAHESGAGSGVLGVELAKRFETVYLSDSSQLNIELARCRLAPSPHSWKFEYKVAGPENTVWIEKGRVSLVTVTYNFNLLWKKPEKIVGAAADALAPGGTLAVSMYMDRPFFTAIPESNLWGDPMFKALNAHTCKVHETLSIGMDAISLDGETWKDKKYVKWNQGFAAEPGMVKELGSKYVEEIERILNEYGEKAELSWPCSVLLATKI